jgi:hypothetical protein
MLSSYDLNFHYEMCGVLLFSYSYSIITALSLENLVQVWNRKQISLLITFWRLMQIFSTIYFQTIK